MKKSNMQDINNKVLLFEHTANKNTPILHKLKNFLKFKNTFSNSPLKNQSLPQTPQPHLVHH